MIELQEALVIAISTMAGVVTLMSGVVAFLYRRVSDMHTDCIIERRMLLDKLIKIEEYLLSKVG